MDHKILIIDGHPVYIHKLEGFLRGLTYSHILLAGSGEAGLAYLRQTQMDLVLLSGMLPDMNAHMVCKEARAISPTVRIIVQTGLFTDASDVELFLQMGADVVLDRKEKDFKLLEDHIVFLLTA